MLNKLMKTVTITSDMSTAQRALAVSSAIRSAFKALKRSTKRADRAMTKSVKSIGERNEAGAHRSKS
jgi:hypothetical protein